MSGFNNYAGCECQGFNNCMLGVNVGVSITVCPRSVSVLGVCWLPITVLCVRQGFVWYANVVG